MATDKTTIWGYNRVTGYWVPQNSGTREFCTGLLRYFEQDTTKFSLFKISKKRPAFPKQTPTIR